VGYWYLNTPDWVKTLPKNHWIENLLGVRKNCPSTISLDTFDNIALNRDWLRSNVYPAEVISEFPLVFSSKEEVAREINVHERVLASLSDDQTNVLAYLYFNSKDADTTTMMFYNVDDSWEPDLNALLSKAKELFPKTKRLSVAVSYEEATPFTLVGFNIAAPDDFQTRMLAGFPSMINDLKKHLLVSCRYASDSGSYSVVKNYWLNKEPESLKTPPPQAAQLFNFLVVNSKRNSRSDILDIATLSDSTCPYKQH
jgi:hypothetical protein